MPSNQNDKNQRDETPELQIRFIERLTEPGPDENQGPQFHRWLPDGRNDSLEVETSSDLELEVWLERKGYVDSKFSERIRFHPDRRQVDESLMQRQSPLNAGGPLHGLAVFPEVNRKEVEALRNDKRGSPAYENLGRRVVQAIYPPVSSFVNYLRLNLGQYWIRSTSEWNSQKLSLGAYCSRRHMKWRLSEEDDWMEFVPNQKESSPIRLTVTFGGKEELFISQENWKSLPSEVEANYKHNHELSTAAELLIKAHRLEDLGNLRQALLEGVTSLELAAEDFVRRRSKGSSALKRVATNAASNKLSRKEQIALLVDTDAVSTDDLEGALTAIDYRNQIVHDGDLETEDGEKGQKQALRSLMKTIAHLLPHSPVLFSTTETSLSMYPEEDTEE